MPTLLLIRHAAAAERDPQKWPDDADRPLTRKGARRFRDLLEAIELPDLAQNQGRILSSRYARAWETAEILAEHVGADAERCTALEEQGVDAMLQAVRASLAGGVASVAMVGHEPFMSTLAGQLLGAPQWPARLRFRKGAIAALRIDASLEPGTAALEWFVAPGLVKT